MEMPLEMPFTVRFAQYTAPHQHTAVVVPVDAYLSMTEIVRRLGLHAHARPVMVLIGGASKLSEDDLSRIKRLFFEVLAPMAQRWQACVVDGGTDAGVMRLMGEARWAIGGTFPLVGVLPVGLAGLPGQPLPSAEAAPLESHHTHFVLVPGNTWGDESPWLAEIASAVAGPLPSVTVLINGGEVTWRDAAQNVRVGRSVITIEGSGRTADLLAAGLRGEPTDDRALPLVASGQVQAVSLAAPLQTLTTLVEMLWQPPP
jgi:hypothetical protein